MANKYKTIIFLLVTNNIELQFRSMNSHTKRLFFKIVIATKNDRLFHIINIILPIFGNK